MNIKVYKDIKLNIFVGYALTNTKQDKQVCGADA